MKQLTNLELAELLRKVSAAYQILNENRFKIIAYDRAADSIEHLTSDAKDLWDDGKLDEIPGIGEGISHYLDELFRTGHVKHFGDVMKRVPEAVFPLLLVPGIGPKKSYRLVKEFGFTRAKTAVSDLERVAKAGKIASLEGFGQKSEEVILSSLSLFKKGAIKENRMELPIADAIAQDVMVYLRKSHDVEHVDALGSLRRMVSTIGDIDIAVATKKPDVVVSHFVKYPHEKLIDEGPQGATLLLHSGRQVDLRVQNPAKYGAMLQYFTGSKNHNIKLRELALSKGLSLNEYGIKNVKTRRMRSFHSEVEFYKEIGLSWIPPELREDQGEVEAALRGKLPKLVELSDMKGDLHMHTDYDLEPSHNLGSDAFVKHLDKAVSLGYEYIGISDHNPSMTNHTKDQITQIMRKRKETYEQIHAAWGKRVALFIMCEVDILPDGKLALPKEAFEYVDAVIVSIHSSFTQPRSEVTKRVVNALTAHPKVRFFGHPTGRLLTKREGVDLNWKEIFAVCKDQDIALEINAYPQRLDLPDTIVYDAVREGIKLCINTDAHAVDQMNMMKYGVSVARRGWATARDIVDTMEYNGFKKWLDKL
ncbi:hypothetical protein A2875_00095 [Candidatus Gottesmanbacteria bacterium RIFCSPHIGHO2_01_FULL_46_14]|uniref:DNA-directed DNA polymerase X domain-containing protein n=3 Tax=Microgenomates group TaxID=1794810 RepID=A0A1F5ZKZ6_9BACT|nr:MAG: polymerase beta family protein [Candidatus Curtissbacteria bacterium GW2011_GWA1_41_11]OGG13091.1 MAG: hypothetical protein A2875_00095 [Candidatus Gottesmanbacteria bacterium RIFCSPHIGHO2_01_FULL_46_14]OGG29009.1 MAG: hypothetical protein A2971_03235 [Candidatus Gottesmanbacteria bacterium RIFCSPLOWO2_01_FULL_46_21]